MAPARMPNWEAVDLRLKEERRRNLPTTDTSEAIGQLRLAWQVASLQKKQERATGLIQQQACFSKLRPLSSPESADG